MIVLVHMQNMWVAKQDNLMKWAKSQDVGYDKDWAMVNNTD